MSSLPPPLLQYLSRSRTRGTLRLDNVHLFPDPPSRKRYIHYRVILDIMFGKSGCIRNGSPRHRFGGWLRFIHTITVLGFCGRLDRYFDIKPHVIRRDDVFAAHGEGDFGFDPTERVGGRGVDEEGLIPPLDSDVAAGSFGVVLRLSSGWKKLSDEDQICSSIAEEDEGGCWMCSKAFDRTKNEKCMDKRSLFSRGRAHYFIRAFTGKSLAIAADECLTHGQYCSRRWTGTRVGTATRKEDGNQVGTGTR